MTLVRDAETKDIEINTEDCRYCKGNSSCVKEYDIDRNPIYMTSQEWCANAGVCAATIDWDKVYGHIE